MKRAKKRVFIGRRQDNDEWVEGYFDCVTDNYTPKNRCYITTFKKLDNGEIILTERFEVVPETVESRDVNDLLYVIRTNMTSITRYVRHERAKHPTLTEGQFLDQHLKYKELAEIAVTNILNYINGDGESEE